ncbi:hypothetical protein [uncultured Aquimarina sp.]|uniref:hypothetical protein n=1 Tax=uncultured Aquimarina sp. TaxID=575652 RepID=UPI00260B3905|nr:hypothetical protein [uncultured Aquimarina sp.]
MNMDARKLELIQLIMDCYNLEILNKIENTLNEIQDNTVLEPNQVYKTDSLDSVSESHYMLLEEDRRRHLNGEIKGSTWDEVEKRLRKKYDL